MAAIPPKPSKPARVKKDYLEQPYQAGDTIPAPDVEEHVGESAWAAWSEIEHQHQRRFADTAPASQLFPMDTEQRGWAATVPGGLPAAKGPIGPVAPRATPAPAPTVDSAMLIARKNNRVCPNAQQWDAFCVLITQAAAQAGAKARQALPAAATGAAWGVTPPLTKRLCFREQIEWAAKHGVLAEAIVFMESLPEAEWLHMGQDT